MGQKTLRDVRKRILPRWCKAQRLLAFYASQLRSTDFAGLLKRLNLQFAPPAPTLRVSPVRPEPGAIFPFVNSVIVFCHEIPPPSSHSQALYDFGALIPDARNIACSKGGCASIRRQMGLRSQAAHMTGISPAAAGQSSPSCELPFGRSLSER